MQHLFRLATDALMTLLGLATVLYAYGWTVVIWKERPMVVRDHNDQWRAQRSLKPIPPSIYQPPPTRLIKQPKVYR